MNIIVTNNPMVREKCPVGKGQELEFHDTDCLGIFKAVRDRIHQGHELLTHPLSGSVKPGETPFKTIVLKGEKGALDPASLSLIEKSIQTCEKIKPSIMKKNWSEKTLADFQLIDYTLIFG